MMNPSKTLLFNKLKIHHPLPLSSRESKRLLDLLTSSFRQHLDTEHPAFKIETAQSTSKQPRTDSSQTELTRSRRKSTSEQWRSSTDRHMNSMLTNPLFNFDEIRSTSQSPLRPMEVFDLAVARGMMNVNYARALLRADKRAIVESHLPDVREAMRASGAGLKVLKWLKSSGATNDLKFLQNEAFGGILIEYLVAEGLDEVVWTWIKKSFEGIPFLPAPDEPRWKSARRETVNPLMFLVKAQSMGRGSLDGAFMCLSRAAGYLKDVPAQTINILGPPGQFLATEALLTHSTRTAPNSSDFESFISLLPVIFRRKMTLEHYAARLSLIHPTKPDVELALEFLKTLGPQPCHLAFERGCVQLGLDAAKYLLEKYRVKEALWVMDVLRVNFSKQLGVLAEQKKQLEEIKAEDSVMEILEGLSLA